MIAATRTYLRRNQSRCVLSNGALPFRGEDARYFQEMAGRLLSCDWGDTFDACDASDGERRVVDGEKEAGICRT